MAIEGIQKEHCRNKKYCSADGKNLEDIQGTSQHLRASNARSTNTNIQYFLDEFAVDLNTINLSSPESMEASELGLLTNYKLMQPIGNTDSCSMSRESQIMSLPA